MNNKKHPFVWIKSAKGCYKLIAIDAHLLLPITISARFFISNAEIYFSSIGIHFLINSPALRSPLRLRILAICSAEVMSKKLSNQRNYPIPDDESKPLLRSASGKPEYSASRPIAFLNNQISDKKKCLRAANLAKPLS